MSEVDVQNPVRCPLCGTVRLLEFPIIVIVTALTSWKQMRLHAPCHHAAWDATPSDLRAIRGHLGDDWLETQRQQLAFEKLAPPFSSQSLH